MAQKLVEKKDIGMMFTISFFVVTLVNAIVFYLAHMWFPANVVLGTMSLSQTWAVLLGAGTLSLFTLLIMPFLRVIEMKRRKILSPAEMLRAYFVINFIGLWLITRASDIFGIGVSSWTIVLGLALVLDFAQGMVMMKIDQMSKK